MALFFALRRIYSYMLIVFSYIALLVAGVYIFFLTHYWGHRLAHLRPPWWLPAVFHRSHVGEKHAVGHHLYYLPSQKTTLRYVPMPYRNAIDVFMSIPWLAVFILVLPTPYVCTIMAEMAILGVVFSYVHASTHLDAHWLDRFAWYRNMRAKHLLHHDHMKVNFGFGMDIFDKLFRTFRPVAGPLPERKAKMP